MNVHMASFFHLKHCGSLHGVYIACVSADDNYQHFNVLSLLPCRAWRLELVRGVQWLPPPKREVELKFPARLILLRSSSQQHYMNKGEHAGGYLGCCAWRGLGQSWTMLVVAFRRTSRCVGLVESQSYIDIFCRTVWFTYLWSKESSTSLGQHNLRHGQAQGSSITQSIADCRPSVSHFIIGRLDRMLACWLAGFLAWFECS
jgi:hypothetical protein